MLFQSLFFGVRIVTPMAAAIELEAYKHAKTARKSGVGASTRSLSVTPSDATATRPSVKPIREYFKSGADIWKGFETWVSLFPASLAGRKGVLLAIRGRTVVQIACEG
jgi:hypothetical protein